MYMGIIEVLLLLLVSLVLILITLSSYLIIRKKVTMMTETKINEYKNIYRQSIEDYLYKGRDVILPTKKSPELLKALIDLFIEYVPTLDNNAHLRLQTIAEHQLTDEIKHHLTQKNEHIRLNTLRLMETFRLDHLTKELHVLYQEQSLTPREEAQLLKLLAMFNDQTIVRKLLSRKHPLSHFELLSIFSNMEFESFSKLMDRFDSVSKHDQLAMLDAIAIHQWDHFTPILDQQLKSNDIEFQIRSLKVYSIIGTYDTDIHLTPFLQSDVWQLRLMAIKVVGKSNLEHYKNDLLRLLTDQEYLVRKEAANTLLRFSDGIQTLTQVMKESDDLFAIDMASECLEKERTKDLYELVPHLTN